jgi:hypothetical protein
MYGLFTNGQPWLDPLNGSVLKFKDMEDAHRYAEMADNTFYVNYSVDIGQVGLFIPGEYHTPPKYVIAKI